MLTENTKNEILCMEFVDNERIKDLKNALEELGGRIKDNLGGTYKIIHFFLLTLLYFGTFIVNI